MASISAAMNQGGVSGASPCKLTMISGLRPLLASASAQRSVPLRQASSVMMTFAPKSSQCSRMRASSVATYIPAEPSTAQAASQLMRMRLLRAPSGSVSSASGFPGYRLDA
jgi:hypothetical protein